MWTVLPQLLLLGGIAVVVALPLAGANKLWRSRRVATVAIVLALAGGAMLLFALRRPFAGASPALAELVPGRRVEGGYVSSQACRKCHEEQFESWHHSYHRTMTQVVSPETVVAPFEDVVLETEGREYFLSRKGDEFWVNMPDPEWYLDRNSGDDEMRGNLPMKPPQVDRRVVMSTGSHHMQLYWVVNPSTRRIVTLPFVYLFKDQRWVPRSDAFLLDRYHHTNGPSVQLWNKVCISCHAVAGQPRQHEDEENYDSRVAELGIACEACHGPGKDHVQLHSVGRSTSLDTSKQAIRPSSDTTIVNPGVCDSKTSAQICGRCHSTSVTKNPEDWLRGQGDTFLPGQDLSEDRFVVRDPHLIALERGQDPSQAQAINKYQGPEMMRYAFWQDGLNRVSGREYNGLLESPCFQRGEMSCVSCHSLHQSEPDDQLAAGMRGNQACYQCHAEYEEKLTEHTHHSADSEGSRCYNCHMPHTSYGLLKGIRSHTVSNPNVEESTKYGRPNACNLCHLDKTLEWTGEHLTSWYGQPKPELDEEQQNTSAALLWLLRGDAGQRAIAAWHFGWEPARQASGTEWMPPFLAELLVDPYAAVRYIAYHTLMNSDGFGDFSYDYIAPLKERADSRREALERWNVQSPAIDEEKTGPLLMNDEGIVLDEAVRQMINHRDDTPIFLWE